ncbi:hypothetical protein GF312_12030 [Candidatus Poribacteria bacterium]|nr:hypothetical protein [Candidatus Poribacteria bacterium]
MTDNKKIPFSINGIIPGLSVKADLGPPRSESGIGALVYWSDRLWMVTYVSHKAGTGSGTGLYEIDENLNMQKRPESVVGTYANRMVHSQSNQLIIGPHFIDADRNVRTVDEFKDHRLTATMEHLYDPENMIYFLTMEGLMFEVDVNTLKIKQLCNLVKELDIKQKAHFKGGHTGHSRVVVANNTYTEEDFRSVSADGRLAEWDGDKWTILETKAFNEVTGRKNMGGVIFATGWDSASAILKVFTKGQWSTYRLPKATHCFDQYWQTEWPRIREVESERFLMDCHGMFYEISPIAYEGKVWGVRPISTHLRIIPDFCSFLGFLVLGGNQLTPTGDSSLNAGQCQAGLWFGKTDDLWNFGKPKGWGGPWREKQVSKGEVSNAYLMTGFEHKVLHLSHDSMEPVDFAIEIDFFGNSTWKTYDVISVTARGYVHHEFPTGFSAHWVRVVANDSCKATAYFVYT